MHKEVNAKKVVGMIAGLILSLVLLIVALMAVKIRTVQGNEIGVKETWSGVDPTPLQPGTYILFPGWTQTIYTYDLSTQLFALNDDKNYKGRDGDSYHVQSQEGQTLAISLNLRWRLDPTKIVQLHTTVRNNFEEKLVRPTVLRIVKDEATVRKAIAAYSGEGLVELQKVIEKDLENPQGDLAARGIIAESFVIDGIQLDENYIGEIKARQVATQRKLRADEETKAAEAQALKVKAEAQADYNKQVVEAERDKAVGILAAEQAAQKQVIAAKADAEKVELAAKANKKQVVLAAEAEKEAGLLKGAAITAIGAAEAEATKLKLAAYAVPGSDNYTKIMVAESFAKSMWSVKGYLPANMSVNVLSENFTRSVESLLGGGKNAK